MDEVWVSTPPLRSMRATQYRCGHFRQGTDLLEHLVGDHLLARVEELATMSLRMHRRGAV